MNGEPPITTEDIAVERGPYLVTLLICSVLSGLSGMGLMALIFWLGG